MNRPEQYLYNDIKDYWKAQIEWNQRQELIKEQQKQNKLIEEQNKSLKTNSIQKSTEPLTFKDIVSGLLFLGVIVLEYFIFSYLCMLYNLIGFILFIFINLIIIILIAKICNLKSNKFKLTANEKEMIRYMNNHNTKEFSPEIAEKLGFTGQQYLEMKVHLAKNKILKFNTLIKDIEPYN